MEFGYRPEAAEDIRTARRWYESQRPGLADQFLEAFNDTADLVTQSYAALLGDPKFREHLALRYAGEVQVLESYRALLEMPERIQALIEHGAG